MEKERDFYFGKLRNIELICQENEGETDPVLQRIVEILYATDVSLCGFFLGRLASAFIPSGSRWRCLCFYSSAGTESSGKSSCASCPEVNSSCPVRFSAASIGFSGAPGGTIARRITKFAVRAVKPRGQLRALYLAHEKWGKELEVGSGSQWVMALLNITLKGASLYPLASFFLFLSFAHDPDFPGSDGGILVIPGDGVLQ